MKFLFFICMVAWSGILHAQDISTLLKHAEQCEVSMNDEQAFNAYKEALKIQPSNLEALCKCSELCTRIGARLKDDKLKQNDYYRQAKTYAQTALQVNQLSSDANFVMALVMGREAMKKDGKEKIDAVRDIKKYADLSIKYNPQNYKAWFVLGKWYYEINGLNYFERTAVKLFFGALPPASIDDAINCLEKVKSLNPSFILNYLSLAKAYKRKDEENIARQNLTVMFTLPNRTEDDENIKKEGKELIKKWN